MLNKIDDWLNTVTMYQLVLWGLRGLFVLSMVLSLVGMLELPTIGLLCSAGLLIVVGYTVNTLCARLLQISTNFESYAITLLIMYFILPPVRSIEDGLIVSLAAIIAIASKFLINNNGKHVFNPAAFAAVMVGLLGLMHASWWIGSSLFWPVILIFGLLVVRKIRRFGLFLTFAVASVMTLGITALVNGENLAEALRFYVTASPLLFLGTIMLTEPATMPPRRSHQLIYGGLVGILFAMPWHLGPLNIYPETALILGNLYAFAVSPRYRVKLRLIEVQLISYNVYNFVFTPDHKIDYLPGQYLEWTLPHTKPDSRGNRRTFSIASSPTEDTVQMGVKFYNPSSTYKKALQAMRPGTSAYAGQIAGDFILPADPQEKLAFIAGGIGITPFRSMLKYIVDTKQPRDVVLIYAVSNPAEFAYEDVLLEAEKQGMTIIKLLTNRSVTSWKGNTGELSDELIRQEIPDYEERTFYVSGPNAMVRGTRKTLQAVGIKRIKVDYFSGY